MSRAGEPLDLLLECIEDGEQSRLTALLQEWLHDGGTIDCELDVDTGDTLLSYAVRRGRGSAVDQLLQHGANPNMCFDRSGRRAPPLLLAAQDGDQRIINMLLRAGAEVGAARHDGMAALHVAAREGLPQTVGNLIALGARIEQRTRSGATAIQIAVVHGHAAVVRVLARAGAARSATRLGSLEETAHLYGHPEVAAALAELHTDHMVRVELSVIWLRLGRLAGILATLVGN